MTPPSLRSSTDFDRVFRTGRRARRDGISVYAAAAARPDDDSRLGLAVRCDRAVDRNRLKRRLRAAWRNFAPAGGFDVAVRAEAAALWLPYQELETHLHRALEQGGVARA